MGLSTWTYVYTHLIVVETQLLQWVDRDEDVTDISVDQIAPKPLLQQQNDDVL